MKMREKIARVCQPTGWARWRTRGPSKELCKELGFQQADLILAALRDPDEIQGAIDRQLWNTMLAKMGEKK